MAGTGLSHAVGALRIPAYRWWFVSQILSASGAMTQAVAQSWLVLQLTGRAVDLGLLAALAWGPVLLLTAAATWRALDEGSAVHVVAGDGQHLGVADPG